MNIVIVGAGVAGLTCGRLLDEAGHNVTLIEADDDIGGRVRSDYALGYTFDRGFQVLFEAYPAIQRHLDLEALKLRFFDPGAIICSQGRRAVLTDPLRDRDIAALFQAALTTVVTPLDKLRILQLALEVRSQSVDEVLAGVDTWTLEYLRQRGFSHRAVAAFFRPFYGGIFLDRTLQTSAKCFKFDFKMLSDGGICVPSAGMGAISCQLAAPLHTKRRIRLRQRVAGLQIDAGQVTGVHLHTGEEIHADAVVLATAAPEVRQLCAGLPIEVWETLPQDYVQTVTLYFGGSQQLYQGKKLLLNSAFDAFVNNAQLISNVAPEYAPEGRHLLGVSVIGVPPLSDDELFRRAMADLRLMFCGDTRAQRILDSYEPLRLYRLTYAQFAQPPGIHPYLPDNETGFPNLYFAGEFTEASSINAAMISGEKCAALLIGSK